MLNPQQFYNDLSKLVGSSPICLAYSGGVDSHVLLHLLSNSPKGLFGHVRAIHIHHGIHADADKWAQHCLSTASDLGIEIKVVKVKLAAVKEYGLEAAARQARYQALHDNLSSDEILLTAQHEQDQAETLMLQLLRGAGPSGLSAMRQKTALFGMLVVRPLLNVSQQDIIDYAKSYQLNWIDDPSNCDTQINRNFLRHRVWPTLSLRWPSLNKTLSRAANHCEDASQILLEVAQVDAKQCFDGVSVSVKSLLTLSEARQRNVLRYILESLGLPLPSTKLLEELKVGLCHAEKDATPILTWSGVEVRRFNHQIYFNPQVIEVDGTAAFTVDPLNEIKLDPVRKLKWKEMMGKGLKKTTFLSELKVRFRQGGEKICIQGHKQHKSLKQLFQEWRVPPWERTAIPLIFKEDELIAVVGYAYAEGYGAVDNENAWLPYISQQ